MTHTCNGRASVHEPFQLDDLFWSCCEDWECPMETVVHHGQAMKDNGIVPIFGSHYSSSEKLIKICYYCLIFDNNCLITTFKCTRSKPRWKPNNYVYNSIIFWRQFRCSFCVYRIVFFYLSPSEISLREESPRILLFIWLDTKAFQHLFS